VKKQDKEKLDRTHHSRKKVDAALRS